MNKIEKIQLINLNFTYQNKKVYKENLNYTFSNNKVYLISGRNGSGKSTLINLIMKLWDDYEGSIHMNNKELKDFTREEISERIGISFQKTPIFRDTIRKNIMLTQEGNLDNLISSLSFEHDLKEMDKDLDSLLVDTSSLSGGQAQKIGILRTVFLDKSVYIFDEATANLDSKARNDFYHLVETLKKDRIIILISHDDEVKSIVDEIFTL